MHDPQFITEHNARHFWHPMAHPAEMLKNPPIVIASAEGVEITDVNGHKTLDAVGGLWNVNLGYSCQPVKDAHSLITLPSVGPPMRRRLSCRTR
jgi:adenosylmethionine-8-amino-7-oxononanoate aminotransferase